MMPASTWTDADTARALQIWTQYQQQHDITSLIGQTAGIDPVSGRIWFGETAKDIWEKKQAESVVAPLYYLRVGANYYVRKGGHQ